MECRYRRAGARGGGRAAFPSWCRARLCPGRRRILGSGWQAEGRVESRGRDDVTAEARLCAQEREPDTAAESPRRASLSDWGRSEEHTSELQSLAYLVCRLLLEKKKKQTL